MAVKIFTKREYTFKYDQDGAKFSITMKFPSAEDIDYSGISDAESEDQSRKIIIRTLRKSIISWTGLVDEDDKPLEVTDDATRAVFDLVIQNEKMFSRIMKAYTSLNSKN